MASAAAVSMSTRRRPEATTQREAAYRHFENPTPKGRSCVQVVALPAGAHVEIEVTAVR